MQLDARTVWAATRTWATERAGDMPGGGRPEPELYIYPRGEEGCFLLRAGKLYWKEDPEQDHWTNTEKSLPAADAISHVVLRCKRPRDLDGHYWPSFDAFAAEVGLPGFGGES